MQNLKFELVWTQPLTYQCTLTMHAGRITRYPVKQPALGGVLFVE
jgi:hypothetical protein